jgi:hypothetical protein
VVWGLSRSFARGKNDLRVAFGEAREPASSRWRGGDVIAQVRLDAMLRQVGGSGM